ncbi:MAG TPA: TrmH family RNA methyltransferase [Candidatus Saccharimonadales bacterium]|nr:TrmH family RNA methyltransferase [Candidatus Saccharimonadales bacterium]
MSIIVIAHNIRSTHNVGSILRTADGFGVKRVFLTGYTPYPTQPDDTRLPHIRNKITNQIHKTALGAEQTVPVTYSQDVLGILTALKQQGYRLVALEQGAKAVPLPQLRPAQHVALLLGEEVHGINPDLQKLCDTITEIPMAGKKESFNVSVATGIALYQLANHP